MVQNISGSEALRAAALGIMVGLAGASVLVTPLGRWAEENGGLSWLFKLRGPRPAHEDVVVVSIDRESSERLGLTNVPRKWPRALHAELVRILAQQGAAVVTFDVIFQEPRDPEDDREFGKAIREAGNVLLFEYLERQTLKTGGSDGQGQISIEKRVPPIPELARSALGLAPFPLPKVPAKVSQVWLFKPEIGDAPTMPMVALQAYCSSVYDELLAMLRTVAPDRLNELPARVGASDADEPVQVVAQKLRRMFQSDGTLAGRLTERLRTADPQVDPARLALLESLIEGYASPHSGYLNFYGPPRTVNTVPYYRVLEMGDADTVADGGTFSGKAVFVGYSEQLQPEQKDGFYTVYSQETGLDLSGVEIAATAFANLLERRTLRLASTPTELTLVLFWGLLLVLGLRLAPTRALIPVALGLGGLYFATVYALFERGDYWLPLAVPLLWQVPLATLAVLMWNYRDAYRERQNIREAFGYHLPSEVVDQLASGLGDITAPSQQMYGICLATDAGHYTTLSEKLLPAELHDVMNRYYETIFAPVRLAGGVVSDVIGDAMLAIWASESPSESLRRQACQAALDIAESVDGFNRVQGTVALPTRIGLHCGELALGHIGAIDHYEYRAVGDIVNTATRIEGLNKQLGTSVLASGEVIRGLDDFVTRELGRFLLKNKTRPVCIHELIERDGEAQPDSTDSFAQFATAREAFQQQRWTEAIDAFSAFIERRGEDGPARYYLSLCERYRGAPPTKWDGVIRVATK